MAAKPSKAAAAPSKPVTVDGLVTAIVAPRKTVMVDGKYVGPGSEVILPADEVAELRALGFLVNPDAADAPATGAGPDFGSADDGSKEAADS